jgi:hypothetical protein
MIGHFIHSTLLATLFYGCYVLFLSNETYFKLNRIYLLLVPVASLLLPLLTLQFQIDAFSFPENHEITTQAAPRGLLVSQEPMTQLVNGQVTPTYT